MYAPVGCAFQCAGSATTITTLLNEIVSPSTHTYMFKNTKSTTMSSEAIPNVATFEIDLEPTGNEGSAFKFRNIHGQTQRPKIVDRQATFRRSDNRVQGYLTTVIHGQYDQFDDQKATIIVAHFRFLSSANDRKFRSASIEFSFLDPDSKSFAPEVCAVAPDGEVSLNRTMSQHTATTTASVRLGGTVGGVATLDGSIGQVTGISYERLNQGSLIGSRLTRRRSLGPDNTARWAMSENSLHKSGIPRELDVAILLKRQNNLPFQAAINVSASVDWRYDTTIGIRKVLGQDIIDPIDFDPKRVPMGKTPDGMDINNLSKYPLDDLSGVTPIHSLFINTLEGKLYIF